MPGIALCASSPKVATPAIVGAVRRLDGPRLRRRGRDDGGVDADGRSRSGSGCTSSRTRRSSTRRRPPTTSKRAGTQLGGKVCGEDTFVGGLEPRPQLADHPASRQDQGLRRDLRRLVAAVRLAADQARSATRASRPRSRRTRRSTACSSRRWPGKVSNFYAEGFACLPTYCQGTQTPQVRDDRGAVQGDVPHAARQPLRAARLRARRRARGGDQEGRLDRRHEDRSRAVRRAA